MWIYQTQMDADDKRRRQTKETFIKSFLGYDVCAILRMIKCLVRSC